MQHFLPPSSNSSVPGMPYRVPLQGYANSPLPPASNASPSLVMEYVHTLLRSRRLLGCFAVLGAVLGWLATLPQTPVYRARTSLDIQGLNENFLNIRSVDPTGQAASYTQESAIQTQIKLLQSDSILRRVVEKLKKEDIAPQKPSTSWSRLLRKVRLESSSAPSLETLLWNTADNIKVKPLGMTRLIEITCDSSDPKLPALFCNTLAEQFIQQSYEIRFETAQTTSDWLTKQLADLRSKLSQSEAKLQSYTQADQLFFSPDKESVAQERLRQLQAELSRAQADRVQKQAQYEMVNASTLEALPMVLDSGPLREYQLKLTELRQRYAEGNATLTPAAPKQKNLQAQMDELQASMQRERANIAGRMKIEYNAAKHREDLLLPSYKEQEKLVSEQVARTAQFSLLKREVESGQQFYEAMAQKVKEAGFASALRASPIRVVDTASDPLGPLGHHRTTSAVMGLFLGSLLGSVIAVIRQRSDRRLRMPGEAKLHLSVRELGTIPSAVLDRSLIQSSPAQERSLSDLKTLDGLGKPSSNSLLKKKPPVALELVTWNSKLSLVAESYRVALSTLLFSAAGQNKGRVVVISSPSMGEGKTTIVSNLAIAGAEANRKIVLIDGDLRKPRLHKIFGVENTCGLRDVLAGTVKIDQTVPANLAKPTFVPGLSLITSGSNREDASRLLHSSHLATLIEPLRKEFDLILIDSPPLMHMADARLLARVADGVVLVLRSGVTTLDTASQVQQTLHEDGTPIEGVILNDFNPDREAYRSYYKSYFDYQVESNA